MRFTDGERRQHGEGESVEITGLCHPHFEALMLIRPTGHYREILNCPWYKSKQRLAMGAGAFRGVVGWCPPHGHVDATRLDPPRPPRPGIRGVPPESRVQGTAGNGGARGNRGLLSLLKIPEPSGLYNRGDSVSPAPTTADSASEEHDRIDESGFDARFAGCSSPGRDPKHSINADAEPGISGHRDPAAGLDQFAPENTGGDDNPILPERNLDSCLVSNTTAENVELRRSLAKADEMIGELNYECDEKIKALAALESKANKLKKELTAAVKGSAELEKARAQDQDRISTLSGQLERSQNKIEELQRKFAAVFAKGGVTGPSVRNLRRVAPILHQLFLGLMKHQKDSVLPDEVLAMLVPLLGARPWGAWTLPPSSNTQIPLLLLYLTTDLTFGRPVGRCGEKFAG